MNNLEDETFASKNMNKVALKIKQYDQFRISNEVISEINVDVNNMLSFAVYNGIPIDQEITRLIQNNDIDNLVKIYNLLCKSIYPATPKSIRYYKSIASNWSSKSFLTKMPLSKNLFLIAFFFLFSFIITSLSAEVNMTSLDKGVLNNQGISLLMNLWYVLSISGLGVMFYLLRSINVSIRKGTIIPEDSAYYPVLIILGLISGLVMSELILFTEAYANEKKLGLLFTKSLRALLGGFSSDVIFGILYNTICKIKKIFEIEK